MFSVLFSSPRAPPFPLSSSACVSSSSHNRNNSLFAPIHTPLVCACYINISESPNKTFFKSKLGTIL